MENKYRSAGRPVNVRRIILTSLALMLLGLGVWVAKWAPQTSATQVSTSNLYVAEPGEKPGDEAKDLTTMDAYWQTRISYPTGKFDRKWVDAAAVQDKLNVRKGVPAGQVTYNRANSASPLSLNPNSWTSIGPRPQDSNTCQAPCFTFGHVSGRVNDIVIDPISPTIAYFAS